VCAAVAPRPVNALAGIKGLAFSVAELEAAGVRRISLGSVLSRVALGGLLSAGREMREKGTFTFVEQTASMAEVSSFMMAPKNKAGTA
jgi:2-methylisocitrate lyase-like PEP mutase family enzyme